MKKLRFALCMLLVLNTRQSFGANEGMPQLNTEFWTSQVFWLVLIFSALYLIIWKIFLPKITNGIENRKSRIINDLSEAQKLKENAEKKLKEYNKIIDDAKLGNKRVKLLYTIPDFHNPTGITMTLQRRQQLAAICNNNHILIVEDRAYTELYFKQNSPQSIYDITNGYGAIQIGSFSKTIATGIRVGWIMADPEYIEILERVRFDMGNSPLLHRALAQYLTSGKLDSHLSKMRPLYDEKCAVLCKSLMDYCHPYVTFTPPEGGFFLWVECLGASSQQLVNAASEEGLQFPTGATFFKDGYNTDQNHIRLAFSNCNIDQLSQVGLRLRDAFHRIVD